MISVWSRWPLEPTAVEPDPRTSVSALVHAPDGPVVVYGTVLPWANDRGPDGTARMWDKNFHVGSRNLWSTKSVRSPHPKMS